MTKHLCQRCMVAVREMGPATGFDIAGHLSEPPRTVVHMLSRLCSLGVVAKKLQAGSRERFVYRVGRNVIPDYELGAKVNGTYKRMEHEHTKRVYGTMTWEEMIRILPQPLWGLDAAIYALCEANRRVHP